MTRLVGAVTIGQAPRPDLLEALRARLPDDVEVVEIGALDALAAEDLPERPGAYPLTTQLRDGRPVTLDEAFLAPHVQAAIDAAEERGARVTLLLCAGGFPALRARGLLVRPFEAAAAELRALGARRIGVVVPIAGQAVPAERKWRVAGFEPIVLLGPPSSVDVPTGIDALVLDFVGHPVGVVDALRTRCAVPVVDLGEAGAARAAARFR
jgi:protein AroM